MKNLILLLNLLLLSQANATVYYINKNGNDKNTGTSINKAWQSVNKIKEFAWIPGFVAGDSILLEGGNIYTTTQGIYIQCNKSWGTETNPITITSYNTQKAIIKAKGCHAFQIWAPDTGIVNLGLKFANLIIEGDSVATNGSQNAHGFTIWNSSATNLNYLHIEDVEIKGFAGDGFNCGRDVGKGRFTNVLIKNTISHNNPGAKGVSPHSGSGIVVAGANNAIIEHCIAYKNGINNNNAGGPIGIWFWDCINSKIQYCESYNNETTNGDGGGFDLDGGCSNCIIQYCYSHNNAGAGYLLAQFGGANNYGLFENNTIRYNISENDGRKGNFAGIYFWGSDGTNKVGKTYVYNNTVYMGGVPNNGTPSCVGFLFYNISGIKMWNNIFVSDNNLPIINSGITLDTSKILFQNNAYYATNGSTFKINWGTAYNSLSNWRKVAKGQECDSIYNLGFDTNPQLLNPGKGFIVNNTYLLDTLTAYKLHKNSPLIDTGLNLMQKGITTGSNDFYGNVIPFGNKFDIGAFDTLNNTPNTPILIVDNDTLILSSNTNISSSEFDITSNTNWEISSSEPWLTISNTKGKNSVTIKLSVINTVATNNRITTLTISGDSVPSKTIVVIQETYFPYLNVLTDSINYSYAKSFGNITIASNSEWSITSSETWVTTNVIKGSNNSIIKITILKNDSNYKRTAFLTISGQNISSKTIVINQACNCKNNIKNTTNETFDVYPNPANNFIYFNNNQLFTVEIYNMLGEKVITATKIAENKTLNIMALKSGAYIVKINTKNNFKCIKIIKE